MAGLLRARWNQTYQQGVMYISLWTPTLGEANQHPGWGDSLVQPVRDQKVEIEQKY